MAPHRTIPAARDRDHSGQNFGHCSNTRGRFSDPPGRPCAASTSGVSLLLIPINTSKLSKSIMTARPSLQMVIFPELGELAAARLDQREKPIVAGPRRHRRDRHAAESQARAQSGRLSGDLNPAQTHLRTDSSHPNARSCAEPPDGTSAGRKSSLGRSPNTLPTRHFSRILRSSYPIAVDTSTTEPDASATANSLKPLDALVCTNDNRSRRLSWNGLGQRG